MTNHKITVLRSSLPNLSNDTVSLINHGINWLHKSTGEEGRSGYILRKQVGLGFIKLNNSGSFVCALPESYVVNMDLYTPSVQVVEG